MLPQDLAVGEAVYIPYLQAVGIVIESKEQENWVRPGIQVVLSNGSLARKPPKQKDGLYVEGSGILTEFKTIDISGFSAEEADTLLVPLGATGLDYQLPYSRTFPTWPTPNLRQIRRDLQQELFAEAFHAANVLYLAYTLKG